MIIYKNIINKNKIEKIILNNFEYYIGEVKNGLPNGKGKKFNKTDKIIYEGDFINGKYEGKGHLSLGKEEYYYGYFKNGEFDGKGILYQK